MDVLGTVKKQNLIQSGMTVAVATSGGEDSVCLLHLLKSLEKTLDVTVVCINVEHGIRGESSLRDTNFVAELCEKLAVPLRRCAVDCPAFAKETGFTLEQAARILRYREFAKAEKSGFCDVVATAHNLNDRAETVLMNIFRGAGVSGASGMPYASTVEDCRIIRPLLDTQKKEIRAYVKENSLPFVYDESNDDEAMTRNFLRRRVFPVLEQRYGDSLYETVGRFADNCSSVACFFDQTAEKLICRLSPVAVSLNAEGASDFILARAVILAAKKLGVLCDIEKKHTDICVDLIRRGENGSRADLTHGISAFVEYGKLTLAKNLPCAPLCAAFSVGSFDTAVGKITVSEVAETAADGALYFDADKAFGIADSENAPLLLRLAETGDFFKRFGGGGKKLCDFFTDAKIPKRERAFTPVIACKKRIIAIPTVNISDDVKIDGTTRKIYKVSVLKDE